jgi:hypothetical protein
MLNELSELRKFIVSVSWDIKDTEDKPKLLECLYRPPWDENTCTNGNRLPWFNPCLTILRDQMPEHLYKTAVRAWKRLGYRGMDDCVPWKWLCDECEVRGFVPSKENDHTVLDCLIDLLNLLEPKRPRPSDKEIEAYNIWIFLKKNYTKAAEYLKTSRQNLTNWVKKVEAYSASISGDDDKPNGEKSKRGRHRTVSLDKCNEPSVDADEITKSATIPTTKE